MRLSYVYGPLVHRQVHRFSSISFCLRVFPCTRLGPPYRTINESQKDSALTVSAAADLGPGTLRHWIHKSAILRHGSRPMSWPTIRPDHRFHILVLVLTHATRPCSGNGRHGAGFVCQISAWLTCQGFQRRLRFRCI